MKYLTFIFTLLITAAVGAIDCKAEEYNSFRNILPDNEANVVSAIIRDSCGMLWIGSNKGLYNYDGYDAYPHYINGQNSNTRVYSMQLVSDSLLFMGTDNGLLLFNSRSYDYLDLEELVDFNSIQLPTDVRCLLYDRGDLWIGSLNGLYRINLDERKIIAYTTTGSGGPTHKTIYSIVSAGRNQIYFGTYDGLSCYDRYENRFYKVDLPSGGARNNLFVNSLLFDKSRECLWIGTEGELYCYRPNSRGVERVNALSGNSVKTLEMDAYGNLLVGTDNGLYIHNTLKTEHVKHDSRKQSSISNDIIWSIYTDFEKNVWIGTDYGLSLSMSEMPVDYVPVYEMTGIGDGNHFYSIFTDAKGGLWLGGSNGLIHTHDLRGDKRISWFRMDNTRSSLPHNRVRYMAEDKHNVVWVCTDGSISHFDEKSGSFKRHDIVDISGAYNSNWAYSMVHDGEGRIWIATCLGGIFVVDRDRLINSSGVYVADHNFNMSNGLECMFVNQLVADQSGNIWVLFYNNTIGRIDSKTLGVALMEIEQGGDNLLPNFMIIDSGNLIWCALKGGVAMIDPRSGNKDIIKFDDSEDCEILSMVEIGDEIWMSSNEGIRIINKNNLEISRIGNTLHTYINMYYDRAKDLLYMGYADGVAVTNPDEFKNSVHNRPLILSAVYVNNRLIKTQGGLGDNQRSALSFRHDENYLMFRFSDLPYKSEVKNKFSYKLNGIDSEWHSLPHDANQVVLNSLSPGRYELLVIKDRPVDGVAEQGCLRIPFVIRPPIHLSGWAKVIYLILIVAFIAWIINSFNVRSRLKMERRDKERILDQSRQKVEFYSNLAKELTSPLSEIVSPVSRLMINAGNDDSRHEFSEIQRNALKINSVIHRMMDFDKVGAIHGGAMIRSDVDIVELADSVFARFREGVIRERVQRAEFTSDCRSLILNLDVLKIESILSQLLSNASKFTQKGGELSLSLIRNESDCIIMVKDNGIGIAASELPFVCQKFYQSSSLGDRKDGTGVGLYIVKTYLEMHKGNLSITSAEGTGTTVVITLPIGSRELTPPHKALPEEMIADAILIAAKADVNRSRKIVDELVKLPELKIESADEKFLLSVTSAIEERIDDFALNVTSLCEQLGVSSKQLYRKVKQLTGVSPVEYIKVIRMKKAAMLLRQNKFTVSEVVYMVGFSNASYFAKCFQGEFGQTPKQYSEAHLS